MRAHPQPRDASTPELGAAAFTTVDLGVQELPQGKALFWDKEARKPEEADAELGGALEKRSKEHGKPNQIIGWHGGDSGRQRSAPAGLPEAGRAVGQRQGPGGGVIWRPRASFICEPTGEALRPSAPLPGRG